MISVIRWRPFLRNTLQGFVTLRMGSGWEIADVGVHKTDSERWLMLPSKPYTRKDGQIAWTYMIRMPDQARWKRFQREALEALDAFISGGGKSDDTADMADF